MALTKPVRGRRAAGWCRRWAATMSLLLAATVATACGAAPTTDTSTTSVQVTSVDRIDDRTRDLVIESPAMGGFPEHVRLLLPAGFDREPDRRWPVLYLLHGAGEPLGYQSWTHYTDVAAATADLGVLVVMPDGGLSGYYSNWWNEGRGGPPAWETFHLQDLIGVLERDWHAGDRRAVAGLSMGGLGAMLYGAHSPKLFRAAASFSGVLDTASAFPDAPRGLWGDPVAQADNWRVHNPVDVAANLSGVALFVSYGNGDPGPLEAPGLDPSVGPVEKRIAPGNAAFVRRLQELGISAQVDAYGPGTHSWAYWQRELRKALPMIMQALIS